MTTNSCLPDTPHVHLRTVHSSAKQQLRGSIPQCDDTISVIKTSSLLIETCETKICELENALVIDKDI